MKRVAQALRERRAQNRANGLCACGRPRLGELLSCEACIGHTEKTGERVERRKWLDCCQNFTHYPNCKARP